LIHFKYADAQNWMFNGIDDSHLVKMNFRND
jgi:hypothetical protein